LFKVGKVRPDQIDCVVVVTQNPDGRGLPHTSAVVHRKLGLRRNCACFDISLGCSGYVYGLSVIRAFMDQNGLSHGLLFTADPYSKIVNEEDRSTALLFGDAATVTHLSERPQWHIGRFDFGTCGAMDTTIMCSSDGVLKMDGKAVLKFCMDTVPDSILQALILNCLPIKEVDKLILHQGSKVIVENIAQRLKCEDKTPFGAAAYGNTVSSSIPLILSSHLSCGDHKVVISGFGVGLSWASTVLKRIPSHL